MVTRAKTELHLVRCTSGDVTVGLEVDRIAAVERGDRLVRRPTDAAPGLLRTPAGEWPVFALSRWLGGGRATTAGQVVLFDAAHGRIGVLVDRVSPVERVPHEIVVPVPASAGARAAQMFSCVALTAAGPLVVLAADSLGAPVRHVAAVAPVTPSAGRAGSAVGTDRLLTFGRTEHPHPGGRAVVFAIPVGLVAEVYDPPPGARLPGAEAHVRELVVWRERPLVVIDAARWVGLHDRAPGARRVVVARSGETAVGLFAGPVVQVLAGALPCVPSRHKVCANGPNVSATLDTSDQTVVIPNWSRLLGAAAGG